MINSWRNMGRNTRIMAVAMVLWAVGEGLWLYIQPIYLSAVGASAREIGFILAMAGLARLLVMVPAGMLADRFGARQVMLPGWIAGAVGVIVIAAAQNVYLLGLGFFLYGGSAMALPIINVYTVQSINHDHTVSRQLSPKEILTFIYGLFWLGEVISPPVGGFLADQVSPRAVFWFSAFWFVLSTIAVMRTEPYAPPAPVPRRQITRPYRQLLRQRHLLAMYAVFTLAFVATDVGYTFYPKYLEDIHDLSRTTIGALGSAVAAGSFFWNIVLGKRQGWEGFLLSVTLTATSFALLLAIGQPLLLIGIVFLMGSFQALRPLATGIMADHIPEGAQGGAFGLIDTLHGLGVFLAASAAGLLYAHQEAWPFVAAFALVPVVFMGVAWLRQSTPRYTETLAPESIPPQ